MALSLKFTKFDNTPWGFRLAGGSDFPQPLTVIRVTEGSLAECMGLKIGDVVVRLNDQPISCLTHGQAHEALLHAGNNFVLGVQREEETGKAAEAISEENIVPYKIALADLPPVFPELILKEETVIERYEEEAVEQAPSVEDEVRQEENKLAKEKPVDANSEIVPNQNLTDDEIAQLILEEEELLSEKGLLGVNFKKLRPRAPILKDSKVLEELQHIATAEPERVQDLKRTSTFLQKPQRPVPKAKRQEKEEDECETYKVVIKKQDKKTVIARLVEKGLLPPGTEIPRTPEPPSEVKMYNAMENKLKEDRPVVSDPNSSCSTLSLNIIDVSASHSPKFDSIESRYSKDLPENPSEDYSMRLATCESELYRVTPNCHRIQAGKFINKARTRPSKCARAHYVERILLRNVDIVAQRLRSENPKPKTTRVVVSKRARTKGRYLAACLRRESIRLVSLLTTLFQFLHNRDASEPNALEIRKRRMSFKGRYLEHVFQRNVDSVLQCVKETCSVDDQSEIGVKTNEPKSTKTKGRYMEKYLHRQKLRLQFVLTHLFDFAKGSLDRNLFAKPLRVKRGRKAQYFKRFVRRNVEIFELFLEYVYSKISELLEGGVWCMSSKQSSVITTSTCIPDDLVLNETKISEDLCIIESSERYEEIPFCSLQAECLIVENTSENPARIEEKTEDSGRSVLKCNNNSVSFEETHESELASSDTISEDESSFSKLLQTENDISTEVFPQDSRRHSRRSISILNEEGALSKLLQSAEDYVSTEVFHRGSRRLSKSRKSIDITRKEDDSLSKFLQSAENYVSTEIFHRGSRRLSRRFSKDIELEKNALSDLLRETGDYVSNEVFHRRNRRLSRSSKKDLSYMPPVWWDGLKNIYFNLPWFSLKVTEKSTESAGICKEKIASEIEYDGRRLSFVPTILYQGFTNRIGVDFTRLVAYAFVPCTSVILLYMYK